MRAADDGVAHTERMGLVIRQRERRADRGEGVAGIMQRRDHGRRHRQYRLCPRRRPRPDHVGQGKPRRQGRKTDLRHMIKRPLHGAHHHRHRRFLRRRGQIRQQPGIRQRPPVNRDVDAAGIIAQAMQHDNELRRIRLRPPDQREGGRRQLLLQRNERGGFLQQPIQLLIAAGHEADLISDRIGRMHRMKPANQHEPKRRDQKNTAGNPPGCLRTELGSNHPSRFGTMRGARKVKARLTVGNVARRRICRGLGLIGAGMVLGEPFG
jgi:hypothetical protein